MSSWWSYRIAVSGREEIIEQVLERLRDTESPYFRVDLWKVGYRTVGLAVIEADRNYGGESVFYALSQEFPALFFVGTMHHETWAQGDQGRYDTLGSFVVEKTRKYHLSEPFALSQWGSPTGASREQERDQVISH